MEKIQFLYNTTQNWASHKIVYELTIENIRIL